MNKYNAHQKFIWTIKTIYFEIFLWNAHRESQIDTINVVAPKVLWNRLFGACSDFGVSNHEYNTTNTMLGLVLTNFIESKQCPIEIVSLNTV